jgi:hypothetical protein
MAIRRLAPEPFWYRQHDEFDDPPPSCTGGDDADADADADHP